jgi:hypothetical protein
MVAAAVGYPPLGGHWHQQWVALPSFLDLMAFPLMLAALVTILSVGRRIGEGLEARYRTRPEQQSPSPGDGHPVLASDVERERAVGLIARAMGEARLGVEEGTDRIDAIWRARHQHQLDELVSDLPPVFEPARRKVGTGPVLALVLSLVAAAVQGILGLWELWPVAVGVCLLVAFGSRRSPGR